MKSSSQIHNIDPVWSPTSRILVLGSFPSVKSREAEFFYGHPQNRFWKVIASVCGEPVPATVPEKKVLLLNHDIALWHSSHLRKRPQGRRPLCPLPSRLRRHGRRVPAVDVAGECGVDAAEAGGGVGREIELLAGRINFLLPPPQRCPDILRGAGIGTFPLPLTAFSHF